MTRLQKKCLIAVAGTHLMLVVLVLCSGFFVPRPKPDETQHLDVIPSTLIDKMLSSGARNAPPPVVTPPTPPQPQVQQQQPTPPPQKPVVQPPPPKPPDRVQTEEPQPLRHSEPKPPEPHKINVDLTPVVRTKAQQTDDSEAKARAEAARQEQEAKEAKRQRDATAKAIRSAARAIKENTSASTEITMPGTASVSYANYESAIQSIYEREWETPNDVSNDDANTRVSVVISRDGTVISAHIITPSGDSKVDASVQRTLDKVSFIGPFPEGSTESQKEFIITFNLKSKRMF